MHLPTQRTIGIAQVHRVLEAHHNSHRQCHDEVVDFWDEDLAIYLWRGVHDLYEMHSAVRWWQKTCLA